MSCMSPYSMPLCTILTKWPAPSGPTQSQQGVPSATLAAMAWKIGFTCGQAAGVAAGHDRRALQGPFLAAGDPRADEEQPLGFQVAGAPGRVGKVRVAAVDQDVARLEQRHQLVDHVDRRRPALTMIMILRGVLSAATSSCDRVRADDLLSLGSPRHEGVDLATSCG